MWKWFVNIKKKIEEKMISLVYTPIILQTTKQFEAEDKIWMGTVLPLVVLPTALLAEQ